MRIHNFRLGFATNSSSSHSIIFIPTGADNISDRDHYDDHYGWEHFTLASEDEKTTYIASQLAHSLEGLGLPQYLFHPFIESKLGVSPDDIRGIDHQSVWTIPAPSGHIPELWIEDLITYIAKNPKVVILGGNDNGDEHYLRETLNVRHRYDDEDTAPQNSEAFDLDIGESAYGFDKSRRDAPGLWTFYSSTDGTKITVDLDPERTARPRSITPELVDLKITDYCPFGCAFCYQGSTTEGKHAPLYGGGYSLNAPKDLNSILRQCGEAGVFEIAFGGGEPTLHPHFVDILEATKRFGMTPSFTTKNLAFFRDTKIVEKVLDLVGGIAYSAENVGQVATWGRIAAKFGGNAKRINRFTVHVVMGLNTMEEFKDILQACHEYKLHVTLLGYKTTKRGADVKPLNYDGWLDVMQGLIADDKCPSISIDTALAQTHGDAVRASGFPSYLFYTKEGQHSAYIDAVAGKASASSYDNPEDMGPFSDLTAIWSQIGALNAQFSRGA